MPYKLIFHPDTHFEIDKALTWYESFSKELGLDFESELLKCYERVATNPLHYFVLHKRLKIRRALLKRFPYKLIFQVKRNNTVCIVALTHQKRKSYWNKRLK
jgi:mRNA-degrading endonuclease RelE of RelBE toxin-antitoxin system